MTTGCSGCSRRTALVTLGVAALASAVPGCMSSSALRTGTATRCAGGLCLDLTAPANAALRHVGGALLIDTGSDTVAVIRTSDTAVVALSAICTHEGCVCEFDAGTATLECRCHGSSFSEHGEVLGGPARRSLPVYGASIAGDVVTVAA